MFRYFIASILLVTTTTFAAADSKTLQDIYALPMKEVEQIVSDNYQSVCDGLLTTYTQGHNDPAKLNPAEFCAVQYYSGSGYFVNKGLWLTDPSGSGLHGLEWAYVRVLDSALKKIKNEKPTTVFRGTSRNNFALPAKGQVLRLKGYTSTSPNREVAEEFIKDRLMIIQAISGKNIKFYSNASMEDEYLLPRSTYVRFEKSEIKTLHLFTDEGPEDRKVEIVYLTEVPRP